MKLSQTQLLLLSFLALFLIGFGHFGSDIFLQSSNEQRARKFEETLSGLRTSQREINQEVNNLLHGDQAKHDFLNYCLEVKEQLTTIGSTLLLYEDDGLIAWGDNHPAMINELSSRKKYEPNKLIKLENGWYLPEVFSAGNYQVVNLLLIKQTYNFENRFLRNRFNSNFDIPNGWSLSHDEIDNSLTVELKINDKESTSFNLIPSEIKGTTARQQVLGISFFLIGLLLLLFIFSNLGNRIGETFGQWVGLAFVVVSSFGTKLLFQTTQFPAALYSSELFDPSYYGSSALLPSLGDFLLSSVILCFVAWYFNQNIALKEKAQNQPFVIMPWLFLVLLPLLPLSDLLKGLVLNSNIIFDLNDLFALNIFSLFGYLTSAFLLLAYFFYSEKLLKQATVISPDRKTTFIAFGLAIFIFVSTALIWKAPVLFILIFVLTGSVLFLERMSAKNSRGIFSALAILFALSIFSTYHFVTFSVEKEHTLRIVKADKIAEERDRVAEYLFSDIGNKISTDRLLKSYLTYLPERTEDFQNRVVQDFLNDYRQKYDISINVYDSNDSLLISNDASAKEKNKYSELLSIGQTCISENLTYNPNFSDKITYVGIVPLSVNRNTSRKEVQLFVELKEKSTNTESGFLELLLDQKASLSDDLDKYDFARYVNGKLISSQGNYPYNPTIELARGDEARFYEENEYSHLVYQPTNEISIIISQPAMTALEQLTFFSSLFLFYVVFILLLVILTFFRYSKRFIRNNFKNRINLAIISVLTVFLMLIGSGTIYYVLEQYNNKNEEILSEKVQSVFIELRHKLTDKSSLDQSSREYLNYLLTKFSKVFFTDINLYDLEGNLLASSRSKIFDENLISAKMNTEAFVHSALEKRSSFIQEENIGRLKYLSAYVPFKNDDDKLLAYLNLPYFAKQSGLQQELQGLISALINAYVLLIVLALLLTVFITERITEPLRVIGRNLQQVRLGKPNQAIEWESRDEIGKLISEYNRVIEELQNSAELLAKSERESAWREMAKQVAHEIKNPLTPMKLSVQMLQKAYNEKKPNWDKNIQKVMQTLLEQIDTLSNIASEFSSFAKMPKAKNEPIAIVSVLEKVLQLYEGTENVKLTFEQNVATDTLVFADEKQWQRAFTNLVQNSIQAIPEDRAGEIKLSVKEEDKTILIEVRDNGSGISEEIKEKIFVPNFTTKTTGMGLGLAMVRNIIESAKAEISFKTEEGVGTTFFIRIKAFRKD